MARRGREGGMRHTAQDNFKLSTAAFSYKSAICSTSPNFEKNKEKEQRRGREEEGKKGGSRRRRKEEKKRSHTATR